MTTPEDRQKAHLEKTRKAVLGMIAQEGGRAGIAELHEFSESKYFVGHQRFSTMMESAVDEGLVTFEEGRFVLTDKGRAFVAG